MKLRKGNILFASLLSLGLMFAPICAHAEEEKTADDYFKTSVSAKKETVTVNLELQKNSGLTSARTVLFYNPEVLEIESTKYTGGLGLEDLNTEYESGDKAGISFAWASDKEVNKGGNILTVEFTVIEPKEGQKVTFETDVLEAYKGTQELTYVPGTEEKNVTITLKKSNTKPSNSSSSNSPVSQITGAATNVVNAVKGWFGYKDSRDEAKQVLSDDKSAVFTMDAEHTLLRTALLQKYCGKNMSLLIFGGDGLGFSINTSKLSGMPTDIDFASKKGVVENFAAGFDTIHFEPAVAKKLNYEIGIHINVGKEFEGKTAYIFTKSLTTGLYEGKKIENVSAIGTVALETDEFTDVMILIAK